MVSQDHLNDRTVGRQRERSDIQIPGEKAATFGLLERERERDKERERERERERESATRTEH